MFTLTMMFLFSRTRVLFTLVIILAIICTGYHISNLFYLQPNTLSRHNIKNDDAQAKPSHKKAKVSTNNETYLWHL